MKMKKSIKTIAAIGLSALMTVSCTSAKKLSGNDKMPKLDGTENVDDGYLILSDAQRDMATNSNNFAFKFFNKVSGFDSKITSPLSASCLLGMLANGADGDTRTEIKKVLEANGLSLDEINSFYKLLLENQARLDKSVNLNIANYIAINKDFKIKDEFKSTMDNDYDAEVENLDFLSPQTLGHINNWCKKHTNGMIPKIIESVDANAVTYIMNAIYFNGTWQDKFEKNATQEERFQGYTRDIKRVKMMHQENNFQYADASNYSAVTLPYGNGAFAMTILLPHQGQSISDMLHGFDADSFSKLLSNMKECVVDLKIPRFSTEVEMNLNETMQQLGAPTMFKPTADFSNMSDANIVISKILQKAKIEVSEEGTKAAATTAAIAVLSALDPETPKHVAFHADRPFVYIISERSTNAIFFIGQFTGDEL